MHERATNVMKKLPNYTYELIFIDNASTDNSTLILHSIIKQDPHVSALFMSRNFGSSQPSILAGLHYATGDCVIPIDGDIQDPPEVIPEFIKKWEDGYDVVYGTRKKRKGSVIRRIGYALFYRIFHLLSYLNIPLDAGDFSLMDKKVVDIIKILPEKDFYLRGLRTWAGFKQCGVEYIRDDRSAGRTSNSFFANFTWAKKAIVNFSYKPLEYISTITSLFIVVTSGMAFVYLYWYFKYGAPQGFSTLLMTILIISTIQLLALSVISEYLIRMFQEIKGRPPYIISEILTHEKIKKEIDPETTQILKQPFDEAQGRIQDDNGAQDNKGSIKS